MDLTSLKDFVELARSQSFSRAAETRNVTQPAFSRRIRALETWVGAGLVDRSSHPVSLTAPGAAFLDYAERLVALFEEAREEVVAQQIEWDETLYFATTQVLSLTFFPTWLRSIAMQMKVGRLNLESNSLTACERLMASGGAQFLLCHYLEGMNWSLSPKHYQSVTVMSDRLVPVSAPDANGRPRFELDGDAETLPLLDYDEDAGLGRIFRTEFDIDALKPRLEPIVASHLALNLGLALDGQGVTWVPESVVRPELDKGTLLAAGTDRWSISMDVRLFRPDRKLSAIAERLWEFALKSASPH